MRETPFLSITAMVADAMLKAEDIELPGLEPREAQTIMIRIREGYIQIRQQEVREFCPVCGREKNQKRRSCQRRAGVTNSQPY